MRYLRHEYILFAATLAAASAFFSLRSFPFAIDLALCAFFTVVVFGYALRKRGRRLFSGDDARSITEIIFAHTVCLTAMVMVLRTGMFASTLPDWLILPVIADSYGRIGPSAFQMLQGLGVFVLGYIEFRVLIYPKKKDPEKEEKKAHAARWRNAELEAERMNTLRLP